MDYIASAENIAAKLCKKYRRIDRLLADMAAIEAAEIYEYSSAVNGVWDFECWVISRICADMAVLSIKKAAQTGGE